MGGDGGGLFVFCGFFFYFFFTCTFIASCYSTHGHTLQLSAD